jgi:hypothetical protein
LILNGTRAAILAGVIEDKRGRKHKEESMKKDLLKKGIVSLALAGGFILGTGALNNANAQSRQRRIDPSRGNGNYGQVESTGNIDRNKNGIDDRYETRDGRVDINQNGIADQDEQNGRYGRNPGSYGNYGRDRGSYGTYDNRGFGVNNSDFQQGYRDGLDRGRDDALTHRAMNPNNSSHYKSGSSSYRAGFERGFYEAYRQNSGRGW